MKELYAFVLLIAASACLVQCDETNPGDIIRPCGSNIQLDCVKKYFGEHAQCKVVDGDNKPTDRYDLIQLVHSTTIDTTLMRKNLWPSHLDGFIEELYFNKSSGNLVLSVNLANITTSSPDTYYVYGKSGAEPVVVHDQFDSTKRGVITAVIPASEGITVQSLKEAEYSAFYNDGDNHLTLGPKILNSKDPVIQAAIKRLGEQPGPVGAESMYSTAYYYFTEYLQNYICDFKVKPNLAQIKLFRDYTAPVFNIVNNGKGNKEDRYEPCGGKDDKRQCAADYFSEQGHCASVGKPDNEPVARKSLTTYMPMYNISYTPRNAEISGLNGNIKELYVNKNTNNLVFSVNFDRITMDSSEAPLLLYQRSAEPKKFTDSNKDNYEDVTLTAVISLNDGLTSTAIQQAYMTTRLGGSVKIETGDGFGTNDPEVVYLLSSLEDPTNAKTCAYELFFTEAHSLFLAYLQKYICDYKIPLSDS